MMSFKNTFHLVHSIAEQANIPLVMIGGFAVNHYNVTRQTVDVDFLITKDGFEKNRKSFKRERFQELY